MRLNLDALPDDPALLQRLVRELVTDMQRRDGEIEKLRLIVKQLQRKQFGRRSEKLDQDQLALGLEDLDADIGRAEARHQPPPAEETEAAREKSGPRRGFARTLATSGRHA
jgi:transposase